MSELILPGPSQTHPNPNSSSVFKEKYTLGKKIGHNSPEWNVYLCTEKANGQLYACKMIEKEYCLDEFMEKIHREIEIMKDLPVHPNIVSFKEALEDDDNFYMILEYCAGGNVMNRLERKKLYTDREAAHTVRQIIQGVKACHDHRLLHRDLKLENIMYLETQEPSTIKIVDFGVAKRFTPGEIYCDDQVGALLYCAPEVVRQSYSKSSEIWSCGVIMYTLLYAEFPFYSQYTSELRKIINKGIVDYKKKPISNIALDLLKKLLCREEGRRITAEEALRHPWFGNA